MVNERVVAEISIDVSKRGGFDWHVFAPGSASDDVVGHAGSAAEAAWSAAGELQRFGESGKVAFLRDEGRSVAYARLGEVPPFDNMTWQDGVVEQVDLAKFSLEGL